MHALPDKSHVRFVQKPEQMPPGVEDDDMGQLIPLCLLQPIPTWGF
jgi:hypothetical protein